MLLLVHMVTLEHHTGSWTFYMSLSLLTFFTQLSWKHISEIMLIGYFFKITFISRQNYVKWPQLLRSDRFLWTSKTYSKAPWTNFTFSLQPWNGLLAIKKNIFGPRRTEKLESRVQLVNQKESASAANRFSTVDISVNVFSQICVPPLPHGKLQWRHLIRGEFWKKTRTIPFCPYR